MVAFRRSARRDERGLALSSPVALVSAAAVILAGVGFVATGSDDDPVVAARTVTATPPASPSAPVATPPKPPKKASKPPVRRGATYVEVYNNSGIAGLAGSTASKAAGAGWQVVGSDNWYGTIPASTVYFPQRLRAEARMLAKDLGIARLRPSIAPMRFDRLTVILTSDIA